MKFVAAFVGILGVLYTIFGFRRDSAHTVLIVGGNLGGYLSPCGCTKPMSGGILRRSTLVRQLSFGKAATIIETGPLVHGNSKQDQLKLEAIGEVSAKLGVAAIAITKREVGLGIGAIVSLQNLVGPKLVHSEFLPDNRPRIEPLIFHRGFVIGSLTDPPKFIPSILGEKARTQGAAIGDLVSTAQDAEALSVLIFDGPLATAKELPGVEKVDIVIYTSNGPAISRVEQLGSCKFFSPGEKGKYLLAIDFDGNQFSQARSVEIVASTKDDAFTKTVFERYLARVKGAGLLAKVPRKHGKSFAGNAKCMSCHPTAARVWKDSKHAKALATLAKTKQDWDPDCVGCHVVGLNSSPGFKSLKATPQLANVGCESCHGPGLDHSKTPMKFRLPKVGGKSCQPCHVPDHSPQFEFAKFWPKIRH